MGNVVNTFEDEANPYLASDGKTLYFTSNMPGGLGGFDLYYISYDDALNFGSPVHLGPVINTSEDEGHPFFLSYRSFS